MKPYQQRVADEKRDLDEKINKLNIFLLDRTKSISSNERMLLERQMRVMREYSNILQTRINGFY